ncbi:hypothetical protein [Paractinoplanes atraurantiacus]|uniref:hypothetical protein n=1 Tax=Paractinoplanes atraurantiacus TaxID=1036182 RepID=UPI0011785530|nr:hypothetical protein [Actinoplanes atraurantiacus]
MTGDLHWNLDIYVSEAVPEPPPEAAAGVWLAGRLRTVVAFQAQPFPPSAFWLVAPDGTKTRARIFEADDAPAYTIDAVERPFPALPGLRVAAIPEVIREHRMPTPITDSLRGRVDHEVAARLGAWEGMVTRLEQGWPPDGWYPEEYYRQDLQTRDELAVDMPDEIRGAVEEIDRRFAAATSDSGGGDGDEAWWWRRIPRTN